jgi:hypothetical protein
MVHQWCDARQEERAGRRKMVGYGAEKGVLRCGRTEGRMAAGGCLGGNSPGWQSEEGAQGEGLCPRGQVPAVTE